MLAQTQSHKCMCSSFNTCQHNYAFIKNHNHSYFNTCQLHYHIICCQTQSHNSSALCHQTSHTFQHMAMPAAQLCRQSHHLSMQNCQHNRVVKSHKCLTHSRTIMPSNVTTTECSTSSLLPTSTASNKDTLPFTVTAHRSEFSECRRPSDIDINP